MSRKGNSPDNGMMESFFIFLSLRCFKKLLIYTFYVWRCFHSLEQLEQAIVDYIDYYNNKRIN